MKKFLNKINLLKNIFGLFSIFISFGFIGLNIYLNKGNNIINYCLLGLTLIYLLVYIHSSFVNKDKKLKKLNSRNYKRGKKLIGFLDNVLILVTIFTNKNKSLLTMIFAIISISGYFIYVAMDIISMIIRHKINKFIEKHKKEKRVDQLDNSYKED